MTQPWFWLQPTVTAAAALVVLTGAVVAVLQRRRADRKEQWWKRTQWALDLVRSDDDYSQVLGANVLAQQARSRDADREDARLLREAVEPLVDTAEEGADTERGRGGSA